MNSPSTIDNTYKQIIKKHKINYYMKDFFINLIKGVLMGGANVIPGVSGGTMAIITGIFERLIHAISALNFTSLRILISGNFKSFSSRIDLIFLIAFGNSFSIFQGHNISNDPNINPVSNPTV